MKGERKVPDDTYEVTETNSSIYTAFKLFKN